MKGVNQMKEQAEKINATELLFPDNKSVIGEEGTENKNIGAQLLKEDELANEHRRGFKLFGLSLQQGGEKHQKRGWWKSNQWTKRKEYSTQIPRGGGRRYHLIPSRRQKPSFFPCSEAALMRKRTEGQQRQHPRRRMP